MSALVRCTPFCGPCTKGYKHSDLLVALLNIDANNNNNRHEHDQLARAIKRATEGGWDKNSSINEKDEEFRFPLLHWACVLGKRRTVRWLLDNGFSPTAQRSETKETALHRVLMTLPALNSSGQKTMFEGMLPCLRQCLGMGDHRQDTPIHVASKFMAQNRNFTLYESLMTLMVSEIQKMPEEEQSSILNAVNSTGDTVLHILAVNNRSFYLMQTLLDAGANPLLVNKLRISPLNIATQCGAVRIVSMLERALLDGYEKTTSTSTPLRESSPNEDVKRRRSERKSSSLATWKICSEFESDTLSETGSLDNSACRYNSNGPHSSSHNCQSQKTSSDEMVQQEINDDAVTSSNNVDAIKSEPVAGICQCSEDGNITIEDEDAPDAEHGSDSSLLHVMEQAGLFPSLNEVITKTKKEHTNKLKAIQTLLKESEEQLMKRTAQEVDIQCDVERMKGEIEKMEEKLGLLKSEKEEIGRKRKLLEEKDSDVRKKLLYCETLLKTVPTT